MVKTIGNPLSWTAQTLGGAAGHVGKSVDSLRSHDKTDVLEVRNLTNDDLRAALRAGLEDFAATRADVMFLVLLYPVIGIALVGIATDMALLPLLFPMAAGFALIGPVAAVGLYEISRRREAGEPATWRAAIDVVGSPGFGAVLVMALYLFGLFVLWLLAASWIYAVTLGPEPPVSIGGFVRDVFTTAAGWAMIVIGMGVGFGFALAALAISVVSFPLLLDRKTGVPVAIMTSVRVLTENPRVILTWGAIVAVSLFLGSLPAFIGLILVLPILGHATWHLYRRAVV